MKIAILGGSFDPPHLGHWWVIQQLFELREDIDQFWLVPALQHQWKPITASARDRVEMLSEYKNNKTIISDIELNRSGISYSIDTVKEIKRQTDAKLYWIVGSDIVAEYDKWDKTEHFTDFATFLVFPRDPYHLPENLPKGFEAIREPSLITSSLSSTNIRKRVEEKKPIHGFVLDSVEKLIRDKKLYI